MPKPKFISAFTCTLNTLKMVVTWKFEITTNNWITSVFANAATFRCYLLSIYQCSSLCETHTISFLLLQVPTVFLPLSFRFKAVRESITRFKKLSFHNGFKWKKWKSFDKFLLQLLASYSCNPCIGSVMSI